MPRPELTIGQAAHATGLTRKAIRVYEAKGLLPPAQRTHTGYRLYNQADLELLTFIRRARTLGLHLDDIRDVLALRNGAIPPCATLRDMLDTRIAELDTTITELLALRGTLTDTRRLASACDDDRPVTACPIIEHTTPEPRSKPADSLTQDSREPRQIMRWESVAAPRYSTTGAASRPCASCRSGRSDGRHV